MHMVTSKQQLCFAVLSSVRYILLFTVYVLMGKTNDDDDDDDSDTLI